MKKEICKCGHDKWYHTKDKLNDGRCGYKEYNFDTRKEIICTCKKFEALDKKSVSKQGVGTKAGTFNLSEEIRKIVAFHRGHNDGVMLVSEFEKHLWSLNKELIQRLKVLLRGYMDEYKIKQLFPEIDKLAGSSLSGDELK